MLNVLSEIPLQKISNEFISSSGIHLHVLRLDAIHPHISGNKWFKLKYNLEEAKRQGKDTLVTFGGAYSNHIVAVAAAGKECGFKTIGIIRGEELASSNPSGRGEMNHTLTFAKSCGMKLLFVSREEYKTARKDKKIPYTILSELRIPDSERYFLPEGGTNELAVKGCAEIASLIKIPFDFICCAVGTGGTVAGIISSLKENQKAMGVSVLKGGFLTEDVRKLISSPLLPPERDNWKINSDYHFGGYAKHTPELLKFISDFEKQHNIPLESVYTGKMMFGIYDLIKKNFFPKNSTVIVIHSGGLPQP